jgi:hypothetical protein
LASHPALGLLWHFDSWLTPDTTRQDGAFDQCLYENQIKIEKATQNILKQFGSRKSRQVILRIELPL